MAFKRDTGIYEFTAQTATTHVLSDEIQIQNKTNDIIVLNVAIDAGRDLITPTGWTQHKQDTDKGFSHHIYWRRTTADDELLPDLVFDVGENASELACSAISVLGCKTTGSPIGETATGNSLTSVTPTWNSISNTDEHSVILWLGGSDRRPFEVGQQPKPEKANATSGQSASVILYEYQNAAQTTIASVTGRLAQSDGWQTEVIELLDEGNRVPVYFESSPGAAIAVTEYTIDQSARDRFETGNKTLENNTKETYTFTTSDTDATNNVINIAVTDNADKRVYKLTGSSLPSGLTNNNYYYIIKNSSSEIALADAGGSTGSTNLGENPTIVALGSTGSGTFTESGIIHSNIGSDGDYDRVSSKSNKEMNWIGSVQTLTTVRDFTNDIIGSGFKVKTSPFINMLFVVFDEDDNWKAWNFGSGMLKHTTMQYRIIDLQNNLNTSEYGTLDRTKIKHWGWFYKLNKPNNRPAIDIAPVFTVKEIVILGGDTTKPADMDGVFAELNESIDITSQNPSALQYLFLHSLKFGNASNKLVFNDSEKSIAFPPFADGVTQFDAYLISLGVKFDLAATNSVSFRNSQIGSNAPFDVAIETTHSPSSTLEIAGTTFVQGTAEFNSTDTVDSILFVGGDGITHNNATITNCTFDSIGRPAGYILLTTGHNISDCTFKTSSATDYAIEINTAGTYALSGIKFNDFTKSLNATLTTGTATINVSGGSDTPTLDNTWTDNGSGNFTKGSATVQINAGSTLGLTNLRANSEVRIYQTGTTTEVAGVENSGTTASFSITVSAVDVVVHHLDYENIKLTNVNTTADTTFPIAQQFDRQYDNP